MGFWSLVRVFRYHQATAKPPAIAEARRYQSQPHHFGDPSLLPIIRRISFFFAMICQILPRQIICLMILLTKILTRSSGLITG